MLAALFLGCCSAAPLGVVLACCSAAALPCLDPYPRRTNGPALVAVANANALQLPLPPKPGWPVSPVLSVLRQAVGHLRQPWDPRDRARQEPPVGARCPVTPVDGMISGHDYDYDYVCMYVTIFFRCLAELCDGSPPATRRRGGYSETLAGGQPGPTRAAPPAAFGVGARGGGSCGGCGSGGRPQRGASQPDDAADRGQLRACDMHATCLHSVLRSVLRSVERGKGRAGRERPGACLRHACDLPTKCPV